MKRMLDTATALTARRFLALLFCSTLSLAPASLAVGAFYAQVTAPERPSPFGLLGVGVLSAMAWLTFCWGQAAAVRICHGELTGQRLPLGGAIRRGLEDVPRVMLAAATRLVLLALGAVPLGAGLPHAAAWTAGLVPTAVLEGAGPRAGLARARRSPQAFAAAQLLPWVLVPVVALNLALAYAALLGWLVRMDPGHMASALRDAPALAVLSGVAWWLVDPLRAAASVAAHEALQRQVQGHDLVRAARRLLAIGLAALCLAAPVRAEPLGADAWSAYLWEAREAVLAGDPDAADQVLTLLGREVQVAENQVVMVTDPNLVALHEGLTAGDQDAVVDAVHHLVVLERLAKHLERSTPLPETWPVKSPPTRHHADGQAGQLRNTLDRVGTTAGRLRAWVTGGDPSAPETLGGRSLALGGLAALLCGLGWLVLAGRRLEVEVQRVRAPRGSVATPLPDALQGTARAAVRQGFLETLSTLERTGQVDQVSRLTNGQVAQRLSGTLWERFRRATEAYEGTWYGEQPAGEPELLAVEEALDAVRGRE